MIKDEWNEDVFNEEFYRIEKFREFVVSLQKELS